MEAQKIATEYAYRKRIHEFERAKDELEWQKKNVRFCIENVPCEHAHLLVHTLTVLLCPDHAEVIASLVHVIFLLLVYIGGYDEKSTSVSCRCDRFWFM